MAARITLRHRVRTWLRFYPSAMMLLMTAPTSQPWASDATEVTTIRLVSAANTVDTVIAELLRRVEQGLPICDGDYACFDPSRNSSGGAVGPATP